MSTHLLGPLIATLAATVLTVRSLRDPDARSRKLRQLSAGLFALAALLGWLAFFNVF